MTDQLCRECGAKATPPLRNEHGVFCNRWCFGDWVRKNLLIHDIKGGLGRAVDGIKQDGERLFSMETARGQALVGTSSTLFVVEAGTFTKSSALGIPYRDLSGYTVRPLHATVSTVEFFAEGGEPMKLRMLVEVEPMLHKAMDRLRNQGLSQVTLMKADEYPQHQKFGSLEELQKTRQHWKERLPALDAPTPPCASELNSCPFRAVIAMVASFVPAVPLGLLTGLIGAKITRWVLTEFGGMSGGGYDMDTFGGFGLNVLSGLLGPIFALIGIVIGISVFAMFVACPPAVIVALVGRRFGNRDLTTARCFGALAGALSALAVMYQLVQPESLGLLALLIVSAIGLGALGAHTIIEPPMFAGDYCEECRRFTRLSELPTCRVVPERILELLRAGPSRRWNEIVEQCVDAEEEMIALQPSLQHCPTCWAGHICLRADFSGVAEKDDGTPIVMGDTWLVYREFLTSEQAKLLFKALDGDQRSTSE